MTDRIDRADLAAFHRVLARAAELAPDDPDSVEVQRAVGHMFKRAKRLRRQEARRARIDHDRAVIDATATGAPNRIDDETAGHHHGRQRALDESDHAPAAAQFAGVLQRAQACYICKEPYTDVDAFHHQLCPRCAADNRARRDQRTDLTGRRALLTGGRAKIGMYIALMLLRDGAHLTITTRFPRDAARRFASIPDADQWLHRLRVVGIDLRNPALVTELADSVAAQGPLDILINNAAQTVRRSPDAYSVLTRNEHEQVTGRAAQVPILALGDSSERHPNALAGGSEGQAAQALTDLAMTAGVSSPVMAEHGTAIDAGGLLPDIVDTNSWVQTVEQVDPLELLEVQLCNSVAPFILLSRLRPALRASAARRAYVVNVSAMEGVFSRGYKGPGHPHTNMAKAALNMLTRTSAAEMFDDGILMTAVDTGWITDERPHTSKKRLAQEGFRAPLDLVDGAARVYHPIVEGERGNDLYGCFLKDFAPYPW